MEETRNDCAAINPLSVLYMGLNLCSSISIVLVNKWCAPDAAARVQPPPPPRAHCPLTRDARARAPAGSSTTLTSGSPPS